MRTTFDIEMMEQTWFLLSGIENYSRHLDDRRSRICATLSAWITFLKIFSLLLMRAM
jgi:excinuclease UvrABC helicase subunit UvrB